MSSDLHRKIRERAYAIWEEEGRAHGRAHDHWSRAERELTACQDEPPHQAVELLDELLEEPPIAAAPRRRRRLTASTSASVKGKRGGKTPTLHS